MKPFEVGFGEGIRPTRKESNIPQAASKCIKKKEFCSGSYFESFSLLICTSHWNAKLLSLVILVFQQIL